MSHFSGGTKQNAVSTVAVAQGKRNLVGDMQTVSSVTDVNSGNVTRTAVSIVAIMIMIIGVTMAIS